MDMQEFMVMKWQTNWQEKAVCDMKEEFNNKACKSEELHINCIFDYLITLFLYI